MPSTMFGSSNPVFQQLERTKQDFWTSHAHLSEEARQQLWSQAASFPSNGFGTTHGSMAHQIPRSMLSSSDMTQLPTMDYAYMDRTYSAPAMGRSTSATGSDSNNLQRSMSNMSTWQSMPQEPATDYTFYPDASMRKQHTLQSIAEGSYPNNDGVVEWNADEYISNYIDATNPSSLSPFLPHNPQQLHVLTPNLQWSQSSDGSSAPSTPSTALMTPLTHSSNPMSRQSSYNAHFLEDTSMLRIASNSSCMLPILSEDGALSFDSYTVNSKTISDCADTSSFPSFTGPASEAFLCSSSHAQSVNTSAKALAPFGNDMSYLAEDMRRSTSTSSSEGNQTDASAQSTVSSRQMRRDREIIALAAARKIAPKAIENYDETGSSPSNVQMTEIRSQDGSSKTVGVLTKTPYVRPQHPKIRCPQCDERPEGFRGTHELDRHMARAHAPSRKGYICVDYSEDKKFLASCKHCCNKKVYGAYYNAAAHLRRAHFYPRKRGRKGKNDEKRGGIGGGDQPPMEYLKMHWIKDVEVDNKSPSSPDSVSDDADNHESTFDIDNAYPAQQHITTPINTQLASGQNQYADYGLSVHASDNMMYDANGYTYDNNVSSADNMSSFQFDAYM